MITEQNSIGSLTLNAIREQEERKEALRKKRQAIANKHLDGKRGRTKGAKGKLTLLREAVLNKAESMVLNDWEEVVQTTLTMAKGGDATALKILWDRVIPSKRAVDTSKDISDKLSITINVSGLEVKSVMDEAVDVEFEEVETDGSA